MLNGDLLTTDGDVVVAASQSDIGGVVGASSVNTKGGAGSGGVGIIDQSQTKSRDSRSSKSSVSGSTLSSVA